MSIGSLKLRLLIAWAIFILIILQISGVGLNALFERSITRRTIAELTFDLDQLERALSRDEEGRIQLARRGPTDPQFDVVNGGRYWQVSIDGRTILRSTSLGTNALARVPLPAGAEPTVTYLVAPDGKPLIAVVRRLQPSRDHGARGGAPLLLSAVNAAEIQEDTEKFAADLLTGLLGIAGLLLVGAWIHVTVGLRPLDRLRAALTKVRLAETRHIEGKFPLEIRPLVEETNALLAAQEHALETARARAGDLAHGLKTPLAIMSAKSRQLRSSGGGQLADELDRQVEVMRRHVQRELARVRARRGSAIIRNPLDLGSAARELVSAIQSLPRARLLDWELAIEPGIVLLVDLADFNDMVGNLLDNAQKWAKSRIRVSVTRQDDRVNVTIEDDGPGVAEEDIAHVQKRGQKADTSRDGSGLGLAIVGDLVELYGGTVRLSRASLGGLLARLEFPADLDRLR